MLFRSNESVRLWVRVKLPEGDEGVSPRGVDGAETTNRDALFGVGGFLRSPQDRMEERVFSRRSDRSDFGSAEAPRLRRGGRAEGVRLRTGGGREASTISGV